MVATSTRLKANELIGTHNILFLVIDTLRFDTAMRGINEAKTPFLKHILLNHTWEKRHTMGTYTYAAHHAFFMGYLPVPIPKPRPYERLFACQFAGSETTGSSTWITQESNIIQGLEKVGYHTICIGGVGFFNKQNALGQVLPNLFSESHWSPELGVTNYHSTEHQVALACERLNALPAQQLIALYINISALHQPNLMYSPQSTTESVDTQLAALQYVDAQLPPLFTALQQRGDTLCIVCSDHGTAYGEDGQWGHGIAHPVVLEVPYGEFIWSKVS